MSMSDRYNFELIERKWQRYWDEANISKTSGGIPKFYFQEDFSFTSHRLHIGHVRTYLLADVFSRFQRMQKMKHPSSVNGIKMPRETITSLQLDELIEQFKRLGFGYDWDKALPTKPLLSLVKPGVVLYKGSKMSESNLNVVDAESLVRAYGADTLRLYLLSAAPPRRDWEWDDTAIEGSYRFINRVWRLVNSLKAEIAKPPSLKQSLANDEARLLEKLHQTIAKVTSDITEEFQLNTAISSIMELVNKIYSYLNNAKKKRTPLNTSLLRQQVESLILMLAPFIPHTSSEVWELIGNEIDVHQSLWPVFDLEFIKKREVEIVVQINGKVKERLVVQKDLSGKALEKLVLKSSKIRFCLQEKIIKNVVIIPGKLVNIVAG